MPYVASLARGEYREIGLTLPLAALCCFLPTLRTTVNVHSRKLFLQVALVIVTAFFAIVRKLEPFEDCIFLSHTAYHAIGVEGPRGCSVRVVVLQ